MWTKDCGTQLLTAKTHDLARKPLSRVAYRKCVGALRPWQLLIPDCFFIPLSPYRLDTHLPQSVELTVIFKTEQKLIHYYVHNLAFLIHYILKTFLYFSPLKKRQDSEKETNTLHERGSRDSGSSLPQHPSDYVFFKFL